MTETILAAVVVALVGVVLYQRSRLAAQAPRLPSDMELETRRDIELTTLRRSDRQHKEIIDGIEEGVLVLNEWLTPVDANAAARKLLGLGGDAMPPRVSSDEINSMARRALSSGLPNRQTIRLWPAQIDVSVQTLPLQDPRGVAVMFQVATEEVTTMRVRRQFVANASHELKSPVASLQALAEAISEAVHDDPITAARFASRLTQETDRLSRLIADLMDLSRLEEPILPSANLTDLSAVARAQLDAIRPEAKGNDLSLVERVDANVWIKGDEQQLGLMLRNLLDNAIKYTPEGGVVTAEVFGDDSEAIVRVSDTGIGIPLHAQARVFERFYRVDEGRSRSSGGTGLGLSIVKHVVELHGGHLHLDSELGEGTVFTIRLPAVSPPHTALDSVAS